MTNINNEWIYHLHLTIEEIRFLEAQLNNLPQDLGGTYERILTALQWKVQDSIDTPIAE